MNRDAFYHWRRGAIVLVLVLVSAAAVAGGAAAPPRTIDDVLRFLEQYGQDPGRAARAQAAADALPPAGGERKALFDFYWKRGRAASHIGRQDQYLADLLKAAEYGQGGSVEHVRLLLDIASAQAGSGNLLDALRAAQRALEEIPPGNSGLRLSALQMLVHQQAVLGDFEAGRASLREAEAVFGKLRKSKGWQRKSHAWMAGIERGRGELFRAEGRYAEAEGAFAKALREQMQDLQEHPERAMGDEDGALSVEETLDRRQRFAEVIERSLAQALLAQGKLVEAEIHARSAIRRAFERSGHASSDGAAGLSLLARIVAEQGRNAEAARLAEASLRALEQTGAAPASTLIAGARRALGAALVAQGRYAEANKVFEQMRDGLKTEPELLKKLGAGDLDWVLAMLRTGRIEAAEKMSGSMLNRAAERLGDAAYRTAEVRAFHAMALAARGEREQARAEFAAAVPVLLEHSRSEAEAETGSIKRQQRLVIVLESYIRLLSEIGRDRSFIVGEAAAESFRLADIARGSSVQRALTASAARANIGDAQLAGLARREQDAQRRIAALSDLLLQLLGAPPEQQLPGVQARMRQDIETLRQERSRLKKEIEQRFPDYAALVDPRPATIRQAQQAMRPGEALVAWYFGEEGGWVWALPASGEAVAGVVPLTRAELGRLVAALRKSLDPGVATIDEIPPFDLAEAYRLYGRILQPVEKIWGGAKVLLAVPHAELGQLPLAVLPTEPAAQAGRSTVPFAAYEGVPWLARRIAVEQLPSVTALASLRRIPPAGAGRREFIGFGDPLFSKEQARVAGSPTAAAPLATRGAPLRLRNAPKISEVDSAELAMLPRLPDTGEEIREIARVLKADPQRDIFLQARATENSVLEADLSSRRVVMFATHGLVPGELNGLTQPALALTSPEVSGGEGDGLLTLDKILALKLNADWVVLSACNTAAGEGAGSEAVSGLGRAFFYAGARALLVSNWPVETVAARRLMTDLFRRQTENPGLAKAESLRRAMLALADGPGSSDAKTGRVSYSYAYPLFWAPFVIVGD